MKNLTSLLLMAFIAFTSAASAQKIKLKKGEVTVDETVWLKYDDCGTFDSTCSLKNLAGEEIIFFKFITVPGVEPRTQSNPDGKVSYVEVVFVGQDKRFEIKKSQKGILELIYNAKAINEDGTLNPENVTKMVEKFGNDISPRFKNYGN